MGKVCFQELRIVLKNMEKAEIFGDIAARLKKAGVRTKILSDREKRSAMTASDVSVLWIADNEETAKGLSEKGEKVLIYLHEQNRESDFGSFWYAFEEPGDLTMQYLDRVYRRFCGLPWNILETPRCIVRETVVEDVDSFYEIYRDPGITEYMENLYENPEDEREYLRQYIKNIYGFYEYGIWTVIEKESGQIIGRAGLTEREGFAEPELGFVIGKKWQGRGYAFEVCKAIIKYGREELSMGKIQALVEPGNAPSLRLCEKMGFQTEREIQIDGKKYRKMVYIKLFI